MLKKVIKGIEMWKIMMVAIAVLGMAMGASVSLADKHKNPPKDPPPKGSECSPGYFKNHTNVWFGTCCDDSTAQCDDLLVALRARGSTGAALRGTAQDELNACFETSPCDD